MVALQKWAKDEKSIIAERGATGDVERQRQTEEVGGDVCEVVVPLSPVLRWGGRSSIICQGALLSPRSYRDQLLNCFALWSHYMGPRRQR